MTDDELEDAIWEAFVPGFKDPEGADELQCMIDRRRAFEKRGREIKRALADRKPSYKEVIARYNRAHGQNPKITLRQICEEMNVNYASIRALKSRYAKQKKPKR